MKKHINLFGVLLLFFFLPSTSFSQVYNYVVTPDYVREGRSVSVTYDQASNRTLFTGVFEDSLHWRGTSFGENTEGLYVGSFDNSTNAQILFSIRLPAIVSAYISSHFLHVDDQSNIYMAGVISNRQTNFPLPIEWGDSTIMFGPNTPHPGSNGIPFITKLAPDGRHIWTKFGEEGFFQNFVMDHAGNFIFISYNNTALSYGHSVDTTSVLIEHYLVKLDPLGNYLWGRSIRGNSGNPFGLSIKGLTIDQTDNIYVGFQSKIDNSSLILGGISYDSLLLPVVQQGNTGILVKLKADGEIDRVRYAHSDAGASSISIQIDEDNNVYWLGSFSGANFSLSGFNPLTPVSGNSSFIAKYDSLGALAWVDYADFSDFGNSISPYDLHYIKGNLYLEGIHVGNPILGAYRFPDRLLGPTNFIAKYLPNRNIAWVHQEKLFGGDGAFGNSVPFFQRTVLPNGEFLSSGHIKQATSFDSILISPLFRRDYPVITSFLDTTFNQGFTEPNLVEGVIFIDDNTDCSKDSTEQGLANWLVRADPGPLHALTDTNGNYALPLDSGQYTLTALPPPSFLFSPTNCLNPINLPVANTGQQISDVDFGFYIDTCFQMSLRVSSGRRRLCFQSNSIITYCNTGLHATPSVPLYIKLPEYISLISASESFSWDADSNLVFQTEALAPGECRSIVIRDSVDCVGIGILGLTQCTRAWMDVPDPCEANNPSWSLASLEIEKECLNGDTILFVIENTGQGDMLDSTEYRLFRDTVLVKQENILLSQNEQFQLTIPSNGQAYRLEVDQVVNHPGNPLISDWIGDCFSTNTATFAANIAPFFPDPEPRSVVLEDIECLPIRGSYDPNDKQVKPLGVTAQNFVKPGRKLDYKIRFQNTGTDTAFTVVLIDTLSGHLNPASFQALGSSHAYSVRMESSGKTRLIITYNDILLPDSTTDLAGSQGFFAFSIDPYPNLTDSTEVFNFADIYFDYNPPVRTNAVRTTYYDFSYTDFPAGDSIQTGYMGTTSKRPALEAGKLVIWPNPNTGSFQVEFKEWPTGNYPMILYDRMGSEVYRNEARILTSRQVLKLDINRQIPAGLYFLRIGEGYTEKVIIADR